MTDAICAPLVRDGTSAGVKTEHLTFVIEAGKTFAPSMPGAGRIVEQRDTRTLQAVLAGDFAALFRKRRYPTMRAAWVHGKRSLRALMRCPLASQ